MKALKSLYRPLLLLLTLLFLAASLLSCSKGGSYDSAYPGLSSPEDFNYKEDANLGISIDPSVSAGLPNQLKLIKTFYITAKTQEFDLAVSSLKGLLTEYNAYIEKSSVNGSSYRSSATSSSFARNATYTIRVPAENAEAFVSSAGEFLKITESSSNVADVSDSYYSIESKLEELKTERDSLVNMMADLNKQTDYNFWLTLETRLSEIRQEIAVYQGQLNRYDGQISYSTVNLTIFEELQYSEERDSFGSRLSTAFRESWEGFWESCQDFAVWFVEAFPTLLVLAAIALLIVFIVRRQSRKHAAKKAAKSGRDSSGQP